MSDSVISLKDNVFIFGEDQQPVTVLVVRIKLPFSENSFGLMGTDNFGDRVDGGTTGASPSGQSSSLSCRLGGIR